MSGPADDLPEVDRVRGALGVTARCAITLAIVLLVYYLLPLTAQQSITAVVGWLVLALAALVVTIGWQVRQIIRARHPTFRAAEALGLVFPVFICSFAATYVLLAAADPRAFTESMSHTASLYFTVVVFGTVGFGDIAPVTDAARLIVALQVILDIGFLALVVRLLFAVSRRTVARRGRAPGSSS